MLAVVTPFTDAIRAVNTKSLFAICWCAKNMWWLAELRSPPVAVRVTAVALFTLMLPLGSVVLVPTKLSASPFHTGAMLLEELELDVSDDDTPPLIVLLIEELLVGAFELLNEELLVGASELLNEELLAGVDELLDEEVLT